MDESTLRNCRILVVEDEFMIADEFCMELEDAGAVVLGPVGTVKETLQLIASVPVPDGAVLDVNLHGETVFPVADMLAERGVPFVFTTGYDASVIPGRFVRIVRCEKPVSITKVVRALGRAVHP